jgi:hypothetical protein
LAHDDIDRSVGDADTRFRERIHHARPRIIDVGEGRDNVAGLKELPQPPGLPGEEVDDQENDGHPVVGEPRRTADVLGKFELPLQEIQADANGRDQDEMDGPQ